MTWGWGPHQQPQASGPTPDPGRLGWKNPRRPRNPPRHCRWRNQPWVLLQVRGRSRAATLSLWPQPPQPGLSCEPPNLTHCQGDCRGSTWRSWAESWLGRQPVWTMDDCSACSWGQAVRGTRHSAGGPCHVHESLFSWAPLTKSHSFDKRLQTYINL